MNNIKQRKLNVYTLVRLCRKPKQVKSKLININKNKFSLLTKNYIYTVYKDTNIPKTVKGEQIITTSSKERLMVEVIKCAKAENIDYIPLVRALFINVYN